MSTILQGRPEAASGFELLSRDGNEILTLDDDVAVLAKGRALHGEREGSPRARLHIGAHQVSSSSSQSRDLAAARARSGTHLLKVVLVLLVVGHDWVVGVRKEETKEGGVYARGMDGTRRTRGGREKQ